MSDYSKFEHLIPKIDDKVRVLTLELVNESEVAGFWIYKIVYVLKDEIKEDHVMGQDMSDALYRYAQILEMPQYRFPKFLK